MACMQMSRCEAEKMKCSNGSQGYHSLVHKEEVHKPALCTMYQGGHKESAMHNNSSHSNHHLGNHGVLGHSGSSHGTGHHGHGHAHAHAHVHAHMHAHGHANHGLGHHGSSHHSYANHSSGHHGTNHHNSTHHHSAHHTSYEFSEKEEYKVCKSGGNKIMKKSSKTYKCSDDSSDSESDNGGHGKKC